MTAASPSGQETGGHRFLTDERTARIADLIAPMLRSDLSWIERRKETVVILDDTAVRREISVDFSLRGSNQPLLESTSSDDDGHLYCAPVFVLPKSSGDLMAFDLEDEQKRSVHLIPREDNARISAETVVRMARETLSQGGKELPSDLETRLRGLALADAGQGELLARRLLNGSVRPWPAQLEALRNDIRFSWWLTTLAHSSVVVVLFRAKALRRKLVKLSFEESITTKQRLATRLGWAPYEVIVDSSLIEARSFHFEAHAPPGLRITRASLKDGSSQPPVTDRGFLRRVHLYRSGAQAAGPGTAGLWLAVSGLGFVGGAFIASLLTFSVLLACALAAPAIASNPTSAPVLLLALPGLIASYIARPDQHALTTRLLAGARRLLLGVAAVAYIAAARVALDGPTPQTEAEIDATANSLRLWLILLTIVAGGLFASLAVTRIRGQFHAPFRRRPTRFTDHRMLALPPKSLSEHIRQGAEPSPVPADYKLVERTTDGNLRFVRLASIGTWFLTVDLDDQDGDTVLTITGDWVSRLARTPVASLMLKREAEQVAVLLDACEEWALPNGEPRS